jgi:hypothetical protein
MAPQGGTLCGPNGYSSSSRSVFPLGRGDGPPMFPGMSGIAAEFWLSALNLCIALKFSSADGNGVGCPGTIPWLRVPTDPLSGQSLAEHHWP